MLSLSIFPRKLPHILIGDNSAEMAHNGTFTGNRDDLDTYLNMPVIAVVILVIVSLLVVILRYMYKHKGTYHTNESKGTELAESADAALRGDPGLCDTMDEGKREYFI
ncbi:glycophorin-C isoform X2 [Electrophorus electricus]|uniref:Neurexin/syndecan/glycophorin C domain-containing protein n=1 Tax=Electrophorus electricus TaxID=8005 RepID=A0AAY5ECM7_ELEEL|nr:glycophorin-C isoform X2 [Electrophorus electricus]